MQPYARCCPEMEYKARLEIFGKLPARVMKMAADLPFIGSDSLNE
jgi:hypothetical protein